MGDWNVIAFHDDKKMITYRTQIVTGMGRKLASYNLFEGR